MPPNSGNQGVVHVGLFSDMFAGRSLEAVLARIRHKLASADLEEASRLVEKALETYPGAEPLRELRAVVRRAQGSAGLSSLKEQVARNEDPLAYEQLIAHYASTNMPAEARHSAEAYAKAHPDRDTPHMLLGEMLLQSFFEDLQSRDAQSASTLRSSFVSPRRRCASASNSKALSAPVWPGYNRRNACAGTFASCHFLSRNSRFASRVSA